MEVSDETPKFKPVKSDRGWMLRSADNDTVSNADGFTVWFASRKQALEAAPAVVWNKRDEWWQFA